MTTFVEGCARLKRGRSLIIMLALLGGAIALSACGSRGEQPTSEVDLEATVAAMVDAKLTETASDASVTQDNAPEPEEAAVEASTSLGVPALITPTPDRSGEIMDFLVANTRHFKGDPDAPVTIIEFSDFQ